MKRNIIDTNKWSIIINDDVEITDVKDIADCFNNHFSNAPNIIVRSLSNIQDFRSLELRPRDNQS